MNKFIIFILCILPIVLAQSTSPIPTPSNQVECSLCKLSVDIIDLELKFTNETVTVITEVIETICHLVGGKVAGEICDYIGSNIERIMNDLAHGMNSTEVCQQLHMCYKPTTSTSAYDCSNSSVTSSGSTFSSISDNS